MRKKRRYVARDKFVIKELPESSESLPPSPAGALPALPFLAAGIVALALALGGTALALALAGALVLALAGALALALAMADALALAFFLELDLVFGRRCASSRSVASDSSSSVLR